MALVADPKANPISLVTWDLLGWPLVGNNWESPFVLLLSLVGFCYELSVVLGFGTGTTSPNSCLSISLLMTFNTTYLANCELFICSHSSFANLTFSSTALADISLLIDGYSLIRQWRTLSDPSSLG